MTNSTSLKKFYPSHKIFLLALFAIGIAGIALVGLCTR